MMLVLHLQPKWVELGDREVTWKEQVQVFALPFTTSLPDHSPGSSVPSQAE
jgi:hypothetical protein